YDPGRSRPDRRSTGRQYVDALVRPVTAAWVSEGARHVGDHHPFYRHEVGRWGGGWRYLLGGRWVDYRSFAPRCYVGRVGVVGRLIRDGRVVDGRPFDRERRRRRWFCRRRDQQCHHCQERENDRERGRHEPKVVGFPTN